MNGPLRLARMAGSSIAGPSAVGWVTDFVNAAYHARPAAGRDVDDLRLAFAILTTYWDRRERRLDARDLRAFHSAFGAARRSRVLHFGRPTLDRAELLAGGERLLGADFAAGYADRGRTGWGIVFDDAAAREAHRPEERMRHAALGPLSPPGRAPEDQRWHTYPAVEVPSIDAALAVLGDVSRWPEFASSLGRFTPLHAGGLEGQTFEIEIVAGPARTAPLSTRGYVTATRVIERGDELDAYVDALEVEAMPAGASAATAVELTTHRGHFIGPAVSRLLLYEDDGRGYIRDVGSWDPMPPYLALPYRLAGHRAQVSFWGGGRPEESMLHQLALRAS